MILFLKRKNFLHLILSPRLYKRQGWGLKVGSKGLESENVFRRNFHPFNPHAGILRKPIRETVVHLRHLGTTGLTKAEAGGELPGPPE